MSALKTVDDYELKKTKNLLFEQIRGFPYKACRVESYDGTAFDQLSLATKFKIYVMMVNRVNGDDNGKSPNNWHRSLVQNLTQSFLEVL